MNKFEFIEERDNVRNVTVYFTKKDGCFVFPSMSFNKDIAYDFFLSATNVKPQKEETVLFTVLTP